MKDKCVDNERQVNDKTHSVRGQLLRFSVFERMT